MNTQRRPNLPSELSQHMYDALSGAIGLLFPELPSPEALVKPHVWRNVKYVGAAGGMGAVWSGWSANLMLLTPGYRTLYIDFVNNGLPRTQRERLFGVDFAQEIDGIASFVFGFVTSLPAHASSQLRAGGWSVRRVGTSLHAGVLSTSDNFLRTPRDAWSQRLAQLVAAQQSIINRE